MSEVCFGVDLGGTTVKIGLFSIEGELLDKWEIRTRKEEHGKYILGDIADSIDSKMNDKGIDKSNVIGIGIGVPGPVTSDGTVIKCANLGWGVFSVADELKKMTGIDNIKVGNDANVAALGEMWQGGGKGFDNIVMVTLGTGVGGGVIIDKRILTGNRGAAGEIGHIMVNEDEEEVCGCGKKGCLEQYASATGVVRVAKRMLQESDEESSLRKYDKLSAKIIFDAAKDGDGLAINIVDKFGYYLGTALAQIAQVVDPDAFVIGGGVSKAGQIILDVVNVNYESHVMFALKDKAFRLAKLGNDAGMYGSAKMVL